MPDHWFYREVYLGEEIPEADFDDAIQRAKEKFQEWERLYGTIKEYEFPHVSVTNGCAMRVEYRCSISRLWMTPNDYCSRGIKE